VNPTIVALLLLVTTGPPAPRGPAHPAPPWDLIWMIGPDDGASRRPRPPTTPALHNRGRALYRARCAACHGREGDGRGPVSDALRPRPTDFRAGVYKLRSTPTGQLPTDQDLFRALSRGMHGTAMRPWSDLQERDRWALVGQLQSFSTRFRDEPPGEPIVVPLAPRVSNDLLDRGERLYVRLRCGSCHGDAGAGDGPAREQYLRDGNRDVRIRDFTRGRFIRGAEMEDLYLTLRVGIEGTPMGAYDGLDNDDLWALAGYVRLLVRERPLQDLPPAGLLGGGP
jgi:mono/diheme cytochrome c family protein